MAERVSADVSYLVVRRALELWVGDIEVVKIFLYFLISDGLGMHFCLSIPRILSKLIKFINYPINI